MNILVEISVHILSSPNDTFFIEILKIFNNKKVNIKNFPFFLFLTQVFIHN